MTETPEGPKSAAASQAPAATVAGIDADAVSHWLREQNLGIAMPLRFALIAGGHSNLTYRVDAADGRKLVLRRPPLGHVLESAHDMGREHKIISALGRGPAAGTVPVATALALCSDPAVNQAPFYIMDYVDGAVLHDAAAVAELPDTARIALSKQVVEVLVKLHALDPDVVGLGDLGRKEAYLARQLKRWTKQWLASKTHEIPEMDLLSERLASGVPEQVGASIVHGDYRLGNMIVGSQGIRAVLDWELCTLGDPLADIGYLLNWWTQPEDENSEAAPTGAGGFLTRAAMAEHYAAVSGRDLSQINYYRAFSHWRLAAIGQGVYKRYLTGAMGEDHGVDLEVQKEGVGKRARAALELLDEN